MNSHIGLSIATVLGAAAILAGEAQATVLVEDTFNYPADTGLNGQSGGTGWGANTWSATDGGGWTSAVPGLVVSGVVTSSDNYAKSGIKSANTTLSRIFGTNYSSGVRYLGAILRSDASTSEYGFLQVIDGIHYAFKVSWTASSPTTTNYWAITGGNVTGNTWSNNTAYSGIAVTSGVAALIVVKMDLTAKTGCLYVNQATEGAPDASALSYYGSVASITVRHGAVSGGTSVDDIRLATTYDEAVHGLAPKHKGTVIQVR